MVLDNCDYCDGAGSFECEGQTFVCDCVVAVEAACAIHEGTCVCDRIQDAIRRELRAAREAEYEL